MLARVATYYAKGADFSELGASMSTDLSGFYEQQPGFRGSIVLERPQERSHVIAITFWEDEASVEASEPLAD